MIEDLSILRIPVGSASQDAAIAAIAALTMRYSILHETGLRALESLIHPVTSPVAKYYYDEVIRYFEKNSIKVLGLTK